MDQEETIIDKYIFKFQKKYRQKLEKYIIYPKERWAFTIVVVLLYIIRVSLLGGFYVVSYVFALFVLHLCVQFLTPQGLPDIDEEDDEIGSLPIHSTNTDSQNPASTDEDGGQIEKGPLIRSMNEFKFWHKCTVAAVISLFCTFSQLFDLPVFWPFLLGYFFMLLVFTVRRQIRHMNKYNYSFFDFFRKSTK
ncbi:hypothetical protein ABPG74_003215 [Tetrahymena malaccensis]